MSDVAAAAADDNDDGAPLGVKEGDFVLLVGESLALRGFTQSSGERMALVGCRGPVRAIYW